MIDKKITILRTAVLLLLLCFSFTGSVRADAPSRVFDVAGLFSEEEKERLEEAIRGFQEDTGMDCAVVTTDDTGGSSSRKYADDFYETQNIGAGGSHDGMLYLIDLFHGEIYISTEGEMLRYLTDDRLDLILDHAYEDASEGNYAASAHTVIADSRAFFLEGIPDGQYNYSEETGRRDPYARKTFPFTALLLGMLAGAGAALVTFFSVKSRYRLTRETYRYPLSEKGRLTLSRSEDRLVNQFVTHRRIPKNPPSSGSSSRGRTTTHRSGSGRTHGGRGRRL